MKKSTSKFLGFIITILFPFVGFAQTTETLYTSGAWICPAGVSSVTVQCWGAGGGGGGTNLSLSSGGGGAGGSYSKVIIPVSEGLSYNYVVGEGGSGASNGGVGGGTWFSSNTTVFAQGGSGGMAGSPISLYGSGAVAVSTSSIGTTIYTGGSGTNGSAGVYGGSGGGGAGSAGNGGNPTLLSVSVPLGGAGGNEGGGNGATGVIGGGNGIAGSVPGGGGSGGNNLLVIFGAIPVRNGGKGGNGQIILTYIPSVPTPVFIEYFNCKAEKNGNHINYKLNVSKEKEFTLILERSSDGKSFSTIQEQKVADDICKHPFEYIDRSYPTKKTYYRLKTLSSLGETKISKIVEVNNISQNQRVVNIGPNPASNLLKLNIETTINESLSIIVTDLSGKKVIRKNTSIEEGQNTLEMDVSRLNEETYIITITGNNGSTQTLRFVKH